MYFETLCNLQNIPCHQICKKTLEYKCYIAGMFGGNTVQQKWMDEDFCNKSMVNE